MVSEVNSGTESSSSGIRKRPVPPTATINMFPTQTSSGKRTGHHIEVSSNQKIAAVLIPVISFIASLGLLYRLWLSIAENAADLSPEDFSIPRSLEDVSKLHTTLLGFRDRSPERLMLFVWGCATVGHMFCIPGGLFWSLLLGALFGAKIAFALCVAASVFGKTCLYLMARFVVRFLLVSWCGAQLANFQAQVGKHKGSFTSYVLLIRLLPGIPQHMVSVLCAVSEIPVIPYLIGTLFGLMPAHFVSVRGGAVLSEIHSISDLYDWKAILFILSCIVLTAVQMIVKRWHSDRKKADEEKKVVS